MELWLALLLCALVAFLVSYILGFAVIPWLHKLKFGQTILVDIGPKWHAKKQGTPTMGGIMIIAGVIIALCVCVIISFIADNRIASELSVGGLKTTSLVAGIIFALMCGAIGLMDDYIKVVKKRNLGLTEIQKNHPSETHMDNYNFDVHLLNNGSLDIMDDDKEMPDAEKEAFDVREYIEAFLIFFQLH